MEISVAYVQPLITWLRDHPELASMMVFLISFLESLAIIGSIVPGSVMMTMVGLLAGTGVIGLKSSLIAAILGAVAGDGASYFLGYYFSDRLAQMWPFSRYPNWLTYGRTYFERHGGKSVFLGRFVGPLRSLIPAIAGMMKMGHVHFFIANFLSAIGWSILYLVPGILVGTASATLSTEAATRLFLIIIGVLLSLWLLGIGIKKIGGHLSESIIKTTHALWSKGMQTRVLGPLFNTMTPQHETQHAQTCLLFLSCIVFMLFSLILFKNIYHEPFCLSLDLPIYFFLQTIRTPSFEAFFTVILLFITPLSIFSIVLSQIGYGILTQHHRLAQYWLSLSLCTFFFLFGFNHYLHHPHNELLSITQDRLLLPSQHLGFATGMLSFFVLTTSKSCSEIFQKVLKLFLALFIAFAGLALLYFGKDWFTGVLDSLSTAFFLSLIHWLFYRRIDQEPAPRMAVVLTLTLYFATSIGIVSLNYQHFLDDHKPSNAQYMLTHEAWWGQDKPILPIYSNNRLGQPTGFFNIQYYGSIQHLEYALSLHGWRKQSTSLVKNFIAKADKNTSKLSLRGQFYLNQKPDLVMSYGKENRKPILVLSLWRSNFHLLHHFQPLWIGTLQPYYRPGSKKRVPMSIPPNPFLQALREFKIRTIQITNTELQGYDTLIKLFIVKDQN